MSKGIIIYILFGCVVFLCAAQTEQVAVLGSLSCGLMCCIATICAIYQEYVACVFFACIAIIILTGLLGHETNGYAIISAIVGTCLGCVSE